MCTYVCVYEKRAQQLPAVNEQFTVYTAILYETNHTLFFKERKI